MGTWVDFKKIGTTTWYFLWSYLWTNPNQNRTQPENAPRDIHIVANSLEQPACNAPRQLLYRQGFSQRPNGLVCIHKIIMFKTSNFFSVIAIRNDLHLRFLILGQDASIILFLDSNENTVCLSMHTGNVLLKQIHSLSTDNMYLNSNPNPAGYAY